MTWQSKPLRFGGTCTECGALIEMKAVGWHNKDLKKVRCVACGPPSEGKDLGQAAEESDLGPDPVGGSAALREALRRRDPKWVKGAAGEYVLDQVLHRLVGEHAQILTDRRVPDTNYNIDHVVIASSGVWIIDAKNWKGKIEYKASSMFGVDERLYVDGKDRTPEIESIYKQIIPVAQLIGDRAVPLSAAMVFVNGEWSTASVPRLLTNKPYRHLGVWITPPKSIAKLINKPGSVSVESVRQITMRLDAVLKPA